MIPTGLVIEIASGFEAQARPRSGLALNHGVTVLNSPGTIDSDYRGYMGPINSDYLTSAHLNRRKSSQLPWELLSKRQKNMGFAPLMTAKSH